MEDATMTDVKTLRERARQHIDEGAVTEGYSADREKVLKLLNETLATEMVCYLRYRRHFYMASGPNSESAKEEFAEHADEELAHAERIAERIVQLGGAPDLNPATFLERSHAEYVEGNSLEEMIKEDLVAERIAIDSYREIVRFIGDKDPSSRRLMEWILSEEEEHAEEMSSLLAGRG
jgi:bacterioferritin